MVNKYGHITIDNKLKIHNTIIDTFIDTIITVIWELLSLCSFLQNDGSTVIRYKLQLTILLCFTYDVVHMVQYVYVPYTVGTALKVRQNVCGIVILLQHSVSLLYTVLFHNILFLLFES